MNILPLDADDLGVTGILYYTIESGEFTATKKMIIVRQNKYNDLEGFQNLRGLKFKHLDTTLLH